MPGTDVGRAWPGEVPAVVLRRSVRDPNIAYKNPWSALRAPVVPPEGGPSPDGDRVHPRPEAGAFCGFR